MRTITAAAVALLLACSVEEDSTYPDPSGLYRVDGQTIVCDGGALAYPETNAAVCTQECLSVDGRDVRRVDLSFRRDDVGPWRLTFTAWDFGACD